MDCEAFSFESESCCGESAMRRGSYFIAVSLWLCHAALAQQPQQREPIDPTPPPRGTASFEPPPALVEDAPLTAQTFVIRAAIANMAETDLAELALSRSHDTAIQAYARRMLDEHRRAQEKLRAVAADTKIALPAMVDQKHQALQDSLEAQPGRTSSMPVTSRRSSPATTRRSRCSMLPPARKHCPSPCSDTRSRCCRLFAITAMLRMRCNPAARDDTAVT